MHSFFNRNLNFVRLLLDNNGKLKSWECIKHQFLFKNNMQFQYQQIIHALPQHRREVIKHFVGNLYIQDHHLIKCNTIYSLEKRNSRELCHTQLLLKYEKPKCHNYHEKKFDECDFYWKLICGVACITTYEMKIHIFQYRILNTVLYHSKKLYHFDTISQSKSPFCELYDVTPQHHFYECAYALNVWKQFRLYLSKNVALRVLTPQSAFTDF